MARVAVIGGGIGGLGTALMLGRRGHEVTLYEQEARQAGEDLDRDFFHWDRPRSPQAVQPHSFLAPVRTVLRAEAPDVYADLLARGAREHHEFDWFSERPEHRPGDEDLVTVRTRRIVLEAALTAAVHRERTVEVRLGRRVAGLVFGEGSPARVTGVRVGAQAHPADLVVDAAGRRSPVPAWLTAAGCRPPVVDSHRAGLAYLCRWYRLRTDGPRDPGRVKTGSAAAFALAGVFPSDNDTFAVNLVLSTGDPTRGALTDPAVFEAAARRFPATAAWLDLAPVPRSAVLPMAGLDNRWTGLADDGGPVVTGLVNAGDSLIHTNPTLGHGAALCLRAARHLAAHADEIAADPAVYHAWTAQNLRPWFDAQVTADRANEERLTESAPPPDRRAAALGGVVKVVPAVRCPARTLAALSGSPVYIRYTGDPPPCERTHRTPHGPPSGRTKRLRRHPLAACAFEDPVVMRARAQVRHLLRPAREAYGTEEVDRHVTAWLDARPDFSPRHDGPTRAEWDALVPA